MASRALPDPHELTVKTAMRRPSANPVAFMASYDWWTARITGTLCPADDPIPPDPISAAAQVEAYAAARRRDAYLHPVHCLCNACMIRHSGDEQAKQLLRRAA